MQGRIFVWPGPAHSLSKNIEKSAGVSRNSLAGLPILPTRDSESVARRLANGLGPTPKSDPPNDIEGEVIDVSGPCNMSDAHRRVPLGGWAIMFSSCFWQHDQSETLCKNTHMLRAQSSGHTMASRLDSDCLR